MANSTPLSPNPRHSHRQTETEREREEETESEREKEIERARARGRDRSRDISIFGNPEKKIDFGGPREVFSASPATLEHLQGMKMYVA